MDLPLALIEVLLLRTLTLSQGLSMNSSPPVPVSKPFPSHLILLHQALPVSCHLLPSDLRRLLMKVGQEATVILSKVLGRPGNSHSIKVERYMLL